MIIGGVDSKVTKILQKETRKTSVAQQNANLSGVSLETGSSSIHELSQSDESDSNTNDSSDEFKPNKHETNPKSDKQMRISLSNTVLISDRYGMSCRETAAITSAVLKDVGMITDENSSFVINKSKIQRSKSKVRCALQESNNDLNDLRGLYFDSRKDKTVVQVKEGAKFYRRTQIEEHISLVQEPGSSYVGHVTPSSGSAADTAQSIFEFLEQKRSTENLIVIGCDGTNVNTGHKGGVIRLMEERLNRPLQRIVCLLHFNKLPLRHFMQYLDGTTSGPNTFSGLIGKQLIKCETLPIYKFQKIDIDLPVLNFKELSKDQKYLYEIFQTIGSGSCSQDLARQNPDPLAHSRWLTAANRILRLYVGTFKPSTNLKTLVTFLLKVYVPSWFAIKKRYSCTDGSRLLWEIIRDTRYLLKRYRDIIDPVIENNAYFAHPENMLLSMLADENSEVRQIAVNKILNARSSAQGQDTVPRIFRVPSVNFNATTYVEMINWPFDLFIDPPILRGISDETIQSCVDDKSKIISLVGGFPCHTQAVERTVKLITEAAKHVCGFDARDGYIMATLRSRLMMPSCNTKCEFKGLSDEESD